MHNIDQTSGLDDLLSDEAINRPFLYYERLRARGEVQWNTRWNGWVAVGYEAVVAGYRDADNLSSDRFSGPFAGEMRRSGDHPRLLDFLAKFFVWKDPPYHTFVRSLVNKAFGPRSVNALRPRVRALAEELSGSLAGRAEFDFLADLAFHVPVIVIAEYLGIPTEARYEVRDWSDDLAAVVFVSGDGRERMDRGEAAMAKIADFLRPIVRARRTTPRDDLITALIFAEEGGRRLSEDEVLANIILMVFAGHETSMNLMTNAVVAFSQFPDQWERLRADTTLARSAVEEALRFDGPIKGLGRWARRDCELGGVKIAAGDRVLLMQHAANRDPAAFDQPACFDISRSPNRHAAFGQGIHTCVGAPLARLEVQETLACLAERFARIEVLTDRLDYKPVIVSRALKRLPTRLVAA